MSSAPAPFRGPFAAGAVLVAAIALVYVRAIGGDFLWDDDLHVSANPTIVGPLGLVEIWTTARANYFPLVLTSFRFIHALFGLSPVAYHVASLGCHALAALVLWRVLRRLLALGGGRGEAAETSAWLGAALWALHPVQVESAAWICELKNTQSAVFFLGATWFWLKWLGHPAADSSPSETRRGGVYFLALVCTVLALLSKPSTVMLPVALALCAWWARRRVERSVVFALAPFFALSALAAGWAIWEQRVHSGAEGAEWAQSFAERIVIAGRAAWFYLGKLAWPSGLAFIYPRWALDASRVLAFLPAVLALLGTAAVWLGRRRRPGLFFATAFFLALLFPVLGFFNVYFFRYSFVSDHFQYLASIGPLALLGATIAHVLPRGGIATAAGVLLATGTLSFQQTSGYRDREALWRFSLMRNPEAPMAWAQLGSELQRAGRTDAAVDCFQRALRLQPSHPEAHNHLGVIFLRGGRIEAALAEFQQAIAGRADFAAAHSNLGIALVQARREPEALGHFEAALRLEPAAVDALFHYGRALQTTGRVEESIVALERARTLAPERADILDELGAALAAAGRRDEAAALLQRATQRDPARAMARNQLGVTLAQAGRLAEALVEFDAAVRLRPDYGPAHVNRGGALAGLGRLPEAADAFQRAVELDPDSAVAHRYLAQLLRALGRERDAQPHFDRAAELERGGGRRQP